MGDIRLIKPWYRSESHRYNCVLEHPIFGFTFELLYIVHLTFMGMAWNKDFIIIIYIYLYYYIYIYIYASQNVYSKRSLDTTLLWISFVYLWKRNITQTYFSHKTTLFKQCNTRIKIKLKINEKYATKWHLRNLGMGCDMMTLQTQRKGQSRSVPD